MSLLSVDILCLKSEKTVAVGMALRRSREMTVLCSPKVTHLTGTFQYQVLLRRLVRGMPDGRQMM